MIKSFRHKGLKQFYETGNTRYLSVQNPERLLRILDALNSASRPTNMNLPGLRFHALKPRRFAVAASGNWRVTFDWSGNDATDVDLEDYH
jgi:proteic killer suppression protein